MSRIDLRRPEVARTEPSRLRDEATLAVSQSGRQQDRFDFSHWPQRRQDEMILGEALALLDKDADASKLAQAAARFLIQKV